MKRFRFRLERLLSLRRHRETEWEQRLAEATGRVVTVQREIGDRVAEKARALRDQYQGGIDVRRLLSTNEYMRRMDHEIEKEEALLVRFRREREALQEKYLEASRDRKVLERLKDRRAAEYAKLQRVEETKQLDDITSGRAARERGRNDEWRSME